MNFLAGILTFVLIVNCLLLILLVLVQLPKKDAGAGKAFGGGTADALFGAGSGNVLTKITKYATGILLVLAILLGYMQDRIYHNTSGVTFEKMVEMKQSQTRAPQPASATQPAAAATPAAKPVDNLLPPVPAGSNAPAGK